MRTARASLLILAAVLAASGLAWADTANPAPAGVKTMVNIQLSDAPVVDGIRALFQDTGFNYAVQPGVKGRIVDMTLKAITFDQALKAFMDAAGLTYIIDEEGTYIIGPAKTTSTTRVVMGTSKPAPVTDQSATAQTTSDTAAVPSQADLAAQQASLVPYPQYNPYPYQIAPGVNMAPSPYGSIYYGPGGIGIVDSGSYYPPFTLGGPGYGGYGNGYGYGYNYGWPPYTIGGGMPYIMGNSIGPPPPSGWVSPEMERLWRAQYAGQLRPYFVTPY